MRLNQLVVLGVLAGLGTGAAASQPVQWRVEDGGNGHWYKIVRSSGGISWVQASILADQAGGYLATITTAAENDWVFVTLVDNPTFWSTSFGPWIGGFQTAGATEPDQGWQWVTGEPWTFSAWLPGEPNNFDGAGNNEDAVHYSNFTSGPVKLWNDLRRTRASPVSFVIEWSSDCNNDGIVDFGQILDGTLLDADANGIPDICEQCTPDLDDNGLLNFFDIAAFVVLFQTQDPRADFNADGLFNFFDFSEYLTAFNAGCP